MGITKRMRVFAGPNGSGKTTIIKNLQGVIPFGVYVNADDIEYSLKESGVLFFDFYQLKIDQDIIQKFFKESTFSPRKRNEPELWKTITVEENILRISASIDSYLAADLAEFIRQNLLAEGISFSYETVMSHPSKLQFLQKAHNNDYRVYLYFIATEAPEINISRVNIRVAQHGHFVPPDIIKERYYKSLQQLKPAVKLSNRAYIFDNSKNVSILVSEITEGSDVNVLDPENTPAWVNKYLFEA